MGILTPHAARAGPGGESRPGPWALALRVLKETEGTQRRLIGIVAFGFLGALAMVAQAMILARIVGDVFLPAGDGGDTLVLVLAGVAVVLVRALAEGLKQKGAAGLAADVRRSLRRRLIDKLFDLGPAFRPSADTGSLVTTVLESADAMADFLSVHIPQMVLAIAIPVLVMVAVGGQFWGAGAVLLVTGPLIPFFMVLIGRAAEKRTEEEWETLHRLNATFLDIVQGLATLKLFNLSRIQAAAIRQTSDAYRHRVVATLRVALLSAFALELVASLATAVVAVTVGLDLVAGRIAFVPALTILMLVPEFYLPQRQMGAAFHQALQGTAASLEVDRILDTPGSGGGTGRPLPARWRLRTLSFEGVSYLPPGREELSLKEIRFSLRQGEHLAVLGESGAGKTTLLLLALAYLRPTQGRIRLNGQPMSASAQDWRSRVAYVSQSPSFLTGTLRENLLLSRPDATEEEMWRALEGAQATAFVRRLPQGLDTPVGDRGMRLSGGEAQRLALARALLREVPVVFLDEPTVHLDPLTREKVLRHLSAYLDGKTAIIVTHDPLEAALAEKTIVLGEVRGEAQGALP